jgi:hypothetical protein
MWDTRIGALVRDRFKLWRSTPKAMLREDIAQHGMGITSLAAEYRTRNTQALIRAWQVRARGREPLPGAEEGFYGFFKGPSAAFLAFKGRALPRHSLITPCAGPCTYPLPGAEGPATSSVRASFGAGRLFRG